MLTAGHSLDSILDMTFAQIEECVICIEMVRLRRLDEIVRPVLSVLGGGREGVSVESKGHKKGKRAPMKANKDGGTDITPYAIGGEKGEDMLRSGLGMLGIGVTSKGDSGPGSG